MQVDFYPQFFEDIKNKKYTDYFLNVEYPKLVQAIEVHGYRGPSKKEKKWYCAN